MSDCTLVLKCNVDCEVYIDGRSEVILGANEVEIISISPGQHILEFKTDAELITGVTPNGIPKKYIVTKIIDAPAGGRLALFDEELKRQYDSEVKELSDQIGWSEEMLEAIGRLHQKHLDDSSSY